MSFAFLDETRQLLEPLLEQALDQDKDVPAGLAEAIAYSCLDGGKRIRPALVRASGRCCGLADGQLGPLMVAVEMAHCFSLVHDDLPCMDDDDTRRGRASTHKLYGESVALLAGDALMIAAHQHILHSPALADGHKVAAMQLLAEAVGASGMVGGQFLDMQLPRQSADAASLADANRRKTGALIRCCCLLPTALLDDGDEAASSLRSSLDAFGRELGACFQIVDDILDETASTENLGKPAGSDRERGHSTYATVFGIAGARESAERHYRAALSAVAGFAERAGRLRDLAKLVFGRLSKGEIA